MPCPLVSPGDLRRLLPSGIVIVVIGDVLLDLDLFTAPDRPRDHQLYMAVGGAGRSAAVASMLGAEVVLISATGTGYPARLIRGLLRSSGAAVTLGQGTGPQAYYLRTPERSVGLGRAESQLGDIEFGDIDGRLLASADAVVVSDYGRGTVPAFFGAFPDALSGFDGHVVVDAKYGCYEHVPRIDWVTPSVVDVADPEGDDESASAFRRLREIQTRWSTNVVVTEGARGATVLSEGSAVRYRAPRCEVFSEQGAGDCFTATWAVSLAAQWPIARIARMAVGLASWYVTKDRYTTARARFGRGAWDALIADTRDARAGPRSA